MKATPPLLLTGALLLGLGAPALAGESPGAERLMPLFVPNRGTVREEDGRFTILNEKGRRVGSGYLRPNGDIEVFNRDGSRRGKIEVAPSGRVRIIPPSKGKQ